MSSFIVEDKTINRIVSWIEKQTFKSDIAASRVQNILKDFKVNLETENQLEELANCFLCLNKLATDSRYEETNLLEKINFERIEASDFQVLKSMECLRYQAGEGDIPKNKLYILLSKLIEVLKDEIINNLKEYEEAVWG